MISRNFIKCTIILQFLTNVINGDSIIKLKDLSQNDLKSAILNILKESAGSNRHLAEYLHVKDERDDKFFGKNVKPKSVKRIHGYEVPFYKYDHEIKNFYQPLKNVEIKKPILNIQEPTNKNNQNKHAMLIYITKGRFNENSKMQFINTIKKIFSMAKEKKLKDLFSKIGHKRHSRKIYTKSGEIHDPLIPGYLVKVETTTPLPKKWLPHYPYWNYWTYEKTLHEDNCPENFIDMNGHCMEIPPP